MDSDDLTKAAIVSLANVGTDRAGMLAMELQRGMDRSRGRATPPPDEVEVPANFTIPATIHQYLLWLDGYVSNGGKPSHDYGYAFERSGEWLYAPCGYAVNGECGARAKHVIVEHGAEVLNPNPWKPFGGYGHNSLFLMDGYTTNRDFWVPIYSDPEFDPYREMARRT